jgi:phosphoribosylformylglycinamidine synthase
VVDLVHERKAGEFVRHLISKGLVTAVHDISDGGQLVAVAEMALAGNIGAILNATWDANTETAYHFGERQGRYLVTTAIWDAGLDQLAESWGLKASQIGETGGDVLYVGDGPGAHNVAEIPISDLRAAHEGFFPKLMGSELTPEF